MRKIEFKRGMIVSAALLLQCVAYGQIPNGERPKMVKAIGAFDIKENLSEEERKAREIKRITDNMVFEEGWLDEAPYPLLNTSEAKKTTSTLDAVLLFLVLPWAFLSPVNSLFFS